MDNEASDVVCVVQCVASEVKCVTRCIPMEQSDDNDDERIDDHLADIEEGAGCTEIWEHLSERREADD